VRGLLRCDRSVRRIDVPPALLELARDQAGLVSCHQCAEHGVGSSTRTTLVRRGAWARVARGVYDTGLATPSGNEWGDSHQRTTWLSLLAGPRTAVPVGLTALALHGVWGLPRSLPAMISYGGRHTAGAGPTTVRQFARPLRTTLVAGREVADVETALVQALPEVGRDLAVVMVDNCLHQRLLTPAGLDRVRRAVRGRRGAARLHQVWPLVDGRAASPLETRARLGCIDAGLPPDDLQVIVLDDDGEFIARGDLGWIHPDGHWVVAEMDGLDLHSRPDPLFGDRSRQNSVVRRTTAKMFRYTGADVRSGRMVRELRDTLGAPRRVSNRVL
jgi:hypothetical protein